MRRELRWIATPLSVASLLLRGILLSMVAFKGYFDGSVIIPTGKPDLPRDRELLFQVETTTPVGVDGRRLVELLDAFDSKTASQIAQAIEQDCERIDDQW